MPLVVTPTSWDPCDWVRSHVLPCMVPRTRGPYSADGQAPVWNAGWSPSELHGWVWGRGSDMWTFFPPGRKKSGCCGREPCSMALGETAWNVCLCPDSAAWEMNPHEPRAGFPSCCLQPVFLCVGPGTDPLYLSGGEVRAAHCLGCESPVGFTCAAGPRGDGHPWLENAGMREIQQGLLAADFCSFVSET